MSTKRQTTGRFQEQPDSWQMKLQGTIALPFPLTWIVLAFILFVIGCVIHSTQYETPSALNLVIIKTILIAAIGNAVVYYEKLLDELADNLTDLLDEAEDRAQKWIKGYYRTIFWSPNNIYAGLLLGILCLAASIYAQSDIFVSSAGRIYSLILSFIIGFLGGSMFWAMLGFARLTADLGKTVRIRTSIFDSKTSVLRAASLVLWKVSITATMVYVAGLSAYYFCTLRLGLLNAVIVFIFGVFILAYYVIPQINIHRTLTRIKTHRLQSLVTQIDAVFDDVSSSPTADNMNQLKELFALQRIVNGKNSWSFGINELLVLLGSVLVPLIIFFWQQ